MELNICSDSRECLQVHLTIGKHIFVKQLAQNHKVVGSNPVDVRILLVGDM